MPAIILANDEGSFGIKSALKALREDRPSMDVVEEGIRAVEADPNSHTVGRGVRPNMVGQVECDASIMNGTTLHSGSVGGLCDYLHAISVARQVMEQTPHVFLAGEGAMRFAGEIGAEKAKMLTTESADKHGKWLETNIPDPLRKVWPKTRLLDHVPLLAGRFDPKGTTVFLVRNAGGEIAGGASTSGWPNKYPGRLGDSPIIGAGLYADNRHGACGCTHTGEMTIRAGTARMVVAYMARGASVQEACHEAFEDLRSLKGGEIGPVVIHAISSSGQPYVLSTGNDNDVDYWHWTEGMDEPAGSKPIYETL